MTAMFFAQRARLGFSAVACVTLSLLSAPADAGCSRADVDHFLSRGFTPEQVVLLCGGDAKAADPETVVEESTEAERDLRELLLRSVDAQQVDVDAKALQWRAQRCAEYAPPNLAGRPRERCGPVSMRVERAHIRVGEIRERVLFFGEHGVELLGPVQQQWEINAEGLSAADQRRLQNNTPAQSDTAFLPLHDKVEPATVANALQRWADAKPAGSPE